MIFSIDVECVAVGHDHNARSVAQISLVVRVVAMPWRFLLETRHKPSLRRIARRCDVSIIIFFAYDFGCNQT